ncbi:MAG: hypothetical protein LBU42_06260 [Prevotellaceae bacterium]|nr:hypothetical protein [Prevotellaceae bacterium]
MKTKLFFFAMLVSVAIGAQTGVTVTPVSVKSNTVTFNVSWLNSSRTGTHNSKVWIFVDYHPVTNNVPSGGWERALIAGTPTATSGVPSRETGNDKGFWLQGTSGSSGTYNAAVTVTLSNVPAKYNWCAYVSDYPPNMVMDEQTYYFKGTPPFILKEANGTVHEIPQTSMPKASLPFVPVSITDKTECPGGLKEVIGSCAYTGTDWYADPEHKCQQRPSGAQNWEAWIKDSRDDELYRIVLMPDNKWWLAQNVKLASYNNSTVGSAISGCSKDECGRGYTWAQIYDNYGGSYGSTGTVQGICPPSWLLPLRETYATLASSIGPTTEACRSLRPSNSTCSPRPNTHGFASVIGTTNAMVYANSYWYTNDPGREDGFGVDATYYAQTLCDAYETANPGESAENGCVRCFRQL